MTQRTSTRRLVRLLPLFLFGALISSLLYGCNETPSGPGNPFIADDYDIREIDLPISSLSFQSDIAAISNTSSEANDAVLVGLAPDGTLAHGLLSLVERSERLDDITAEQIVDAQLTLRTVNYRYGDVNGRRSRFDIVSFDGVFGSTAKWHDTLVTKIDAGELLGTADIDYPDSSVVSIDLDKAAVAQFLDSYYTLDTVGTAVQTNTLKSIALRARQDGAMIGSFLGATSAGVADSLLPTLVITLADTTIELHMGVSNWIVDYPASFQSGPGTIALGGGAPYRTLMNVSLDSIPTNALILRAELHFFIVPGSEETGTTGSISSIFGFAAGDDPLDPTKRLTSIPGDGLYAPLKGFRQAIDSVTLDDNIFFPAFGGTLARWIRAERSIGDPSTSLANNGFIIALSRTSPSREGATVDRIRFYGIDADESVRPHFRVTYAIPKEGN